MVKPLLGRLWFAGTAVVVAIGLVVQLVATARLHSGFFDSRAGRIVNMFCFFTIQSNIIVLVTCALLAAGSARRPLWFWVLRLDGVVCIAVTFVVFHVALADLHDLQGLAKAVDDFKLQKEDFLAVIDGMDMDAAEDIRAPDWAKLDLYCDRVASAVGRLSVRVFGMRENDGLALAHHLGRALQLTNILRDIDEDAGIGRLYLPAEELQKAGITSTDPNNVIASPSLWQPCEAVAARALEHFKEADRIMARNPRKVVKAPKIMEEVYRVMLNGMTSRGWSPPRTRVSVSPLRLSWIAVQYAII